MMTFLLTVLPNKGKFLIYKHKISKDYDGVSKMGKLVTIYLTYIFKKYIYRKTGSRVY